MKQRRKRNERKKGYRNGDRKRRNRSVKMRKELAKQQRERKSVNMWKKKRSVRGSTQSEEVCSKRQASSKAISSKL